MKLTKLGMLCSLVMSAGLAAMPAYADLTIVNGTDLPSTSRINGGFCSTVLGSVGVTEPGATNVVPQATVEGACWINKTSCNAEVFMNRNCAGTPVATVTINTATGITGVSVTGPYHFSASGFQIAISK